MGSERGSFHSPLPLLLLPFAVLGSVVLPMLPMLGAASFWLLLFWGGLGLLDKANAPRGWAAAILAACVLAGFAASLRRGAVGWTEAKPADASSVAAYLSFRRP